MSEVCPMCEEPIDPLGDDVSPSTLYVYDGTGEPRAASTHRSCSLREVLGGIGHLVAHEHWCLVHHDPDAGLTRRQSALLVDAYVRVVGIEHAASIGP